MSGPAVGILIPIEVSKIWPNTQGPSFKSLLNVYKKRKHHEKRSSLYGIYIFRNIAVIGGLCRPADWRFRHQRGRNYDKRHNYACKARGPLSRRCAKVLQHRTQR